MKKITWILMVIVFACQGLFAQNDVRKISKLGMMYWKPIHIDLPAGYQLEMSIPPFTLDYEKEILPILSFASETGFMKIDLLKHNSSSLSASSFADQSSAGSMYGLFGSVGLTGHVTIKDSFEPYIKGSFGYLSVMAMGANDQFIQEGGYYKSLVAGINLYLHDHFGIFGELGIKDSAGVFKIGLVFRR